MSCNKQFHCVGRNVGGLLVNRSLNVKTEHSTMIKTLLNTNHPMCWSFQISIVINFGLLCTRFKTNQSNLACVWNWTPSAIPASFPWNHSRSVPRGQTSSLHPVIRWCLPAGLCQSSVIGCAALNTSELVWRSILHPHIWPMNKRPGLNVRTPGCCLSQPPGPGEQRGHS